MKDRSEPGRGLNSACVSEAYAAYRAGDLTASRKLLRGNGTPEGLHLLGLVEKRAGNLEIAAGLLDRAAHALSNNSPEVAHSQALLARDRGNSGEAEAFCRHALQLRPGFTPALQTLGRLLIDGERWSEAAEVYRAMLKRDPSNLIGRYGLATVHLGQGRCEEAENGFDALILAGNDRAAIRFMRARARLELGKTDEALEDLWISFRREPSSHSLRTLAGALWMNGDDSQFREVLSQAEEQGDLALVAAELWRQSGEPERALSTISKSETRFGVSPQSFALRAMAAVDAGDPVMAENAARACLARTPGERSAAANLITSLLMQGRAEEALQQLRPMREAEPLRQHWIAYEATALRLLGSPDYELLVDMDRLVRIYSLPVPSGYSDIREFNMALMEVLQHWQPYTARPLDQSLRGGTQTTRELTMIRDPVIEAYVRALDEPIRQYMNEVGRDGGHPLTRRNRGDYRIAGSWSVQLTGGGRHVNHVHPEGWISSAYYVLVPPRTAADPDRAGWIKFGEPPFKTVPSTPAQKWIAPEAGQLVLFPSFLWHGTEPIRDDSLRVTAPFDVVPG